MTSETKGVEMGVGDLPPVAGLKLITDYFAWLNSLQPKVA